MIQVDDRVRYKNVLGEWHEGTVIKVNSATYRIATDGLTILSIKKNRVELIERGQKSV